MAQLENLLTTKGTPMKLKSSLLVLSALCAVTLVAQAQVNAHADYAFARERHAAFTRDNADAVSKRSAAMAGYGTITLPDGGKTGWYAFWQKRGDRITVTVELPPDTPESALKQIERSLGSYTTVAGAVRVSRDKLLYALMDAFESREVTAPIPNYFLPWAKQKPLKPSTAGKAPIV
jgi:hypothetical protein